jgi:hypothetical protein
MKQSPPKLSAIIVAALQILSISGILTLSQPHITILGPALDILIQGSLAALVPIAQWVKYFWDKARVASPATAVPTAEVTLEAARAGLEVKPEAIAAAHRVLESKMAEIVQE